MLDHIFRQSNRNRNNTDTKNEEFTFEKAFEVDSRPQIYDDYEEEEEEDEYVDSDSEDDRPTHEIEASWKWINLW